MQPWLSVVVPTFNREALAVRAVESARLHLPGAEIVVVDDASSDATAPTFGRRVDVRYVRLDRNSGVGTARNTGLHEATGEWVLFLDDDDVLLPRAAGQVEAAATGSAANGYPVRQIGRDNAALYTDFAVLRLEDYLNGRISGDYCALIHRTTFLAAGLRFPDSRVGAEHLLWFDVAERFGIPTWRGPIAAVRNDARQRLCNVGSQLARPAEYAEMLEVTLKAFGDRMLTINRKYHLLKQLGCGAYWLLAGHTERSRHFALHALADHRSIRAAVLLLLSLLPVRVSRSLFRSYRWATA